MLWEIVAKINSTEHVRVQPHLAKGIAVYNCTTLHVKLQSHSVFVYSAYSKLPTWIVDRMKLAVHSTSSQK